MQFKCDSRLLKEKLSLVVRVTPSRPEPAILGNLLIDVRDLDQTVDITTFNGSMGVRVKFDTEMAISGKVALPAKLLSNIVGKLDGEITFSIDENFMCVIRSSSGHFEISGVDPSDFPALPVPRKDASVILNASEMISSLSKCLFAASTDLSKTILTGVYSKIDSRSLEFAATDSHRLMVVSNKNVNLNISTLLETTIPAIALKELTAVLSKSNREDSVALAQDGQLIAFELGDYLLISNVINGDYPCYNQLIPQKFSRELICDRKELIRALDLVSVMTQKNNLVKFTLNSINSVLDISADTQDVGNAKQSIAAEMTGSDIEIGFNTRYLVDGLKALPSNKIRMQLNNFNQPVVFSPIECDLTMTYLVMPVQIRS